MESKWRHKYQFNRTGYGPGSRVYGMPKSNDGKTKYISKYVTNWNKQSEKMTPTVNQSKVMGQWTVKRKG
jgi:hypothetical protein